ncbi:MAG TPA: GNAT family acetyltransferase [Oceanospirillaceae bacterium]|nr:GNAT family acetyltransferase [Oceanospirillaceae bacterium]
MYFVDYQDNWQDAVIALWQECELTRPWNDPIADILRKQSDQLGKFVLLIDGANLVASMMIGYDGHRGSVNYLAVLPNYQNQGIGRKMMTYCETYLSQLGCPKINICVRDSNVKVLEFYQVLGYQQDPVVILGKRLIADD